MLDDNSIKLGASVPEKTKVAGGYHTTTATETHDSDFPTAERSDKAFFSLCVQDGKKEAL